jgi:hypothetical protein
MARSHTTNRSKSKGLSETPETVSSILGQSITSDNTVGKLDEKEIPIKFDVPVDTTVKKTYVVEKEVAAILEKLVTDPYTGKKKKGSKGILSKIVNNALYKELNALGLVDDLDDKIQPYN